MDLLKVNTWLLDGCFLLLTGLSPAMFAVSPVSTITVLICALVWFTMRMIKE